MIAGQNRPQDLLERARRSGLREAEIQQLLRRVCGRPGFDTAESERKFETALNLLLEERRNRRSGR